jgi:cell division septation protein DedD
MFARSLVVLLLMLNLGVALWWMARPAPAEAPVQQAPAGIARLQLLEEVPARARPAVVVPVQGPAPVEAADGSDPQVDAVATDLRCFRIGPFADAAAAAGARSQLIARGAMRAQSRQATPGARGWNVSMPPLADRAAADAMAARIRAAGFEDLFIVPAGEAANSIALGRYGTEATARQRVATLQAAGFEVQARPIGDLATQHWLDVAAGPGFDVAAAQAVGGMARIDPVDCPTPG